MIKINSVNMIKKAKVVVLILCLLLTVTGCEKNDSSNRGYASSDEAKIEFEKNVRKSYGVCKKCRW